MTMSRRAVLAGSGAGLASASATGAAGRDWTELARRSEAGNDALMRGDLQRFRALVPLTDDFLLMSPFGGAPTLAADMTPERWAAMGRFFRDGALKQQVLAAYPSADMVVLAVIERAEVAVGGLPKQPWPLRVTLVYRREGTDWRLAHRHADPLVHGVSLEAAAALARGEGRPEAR